MPKAETEKAISSWRTCKTWKSSAHLADASEVAEQLAREASLMRD
ncbi:hypothetical protein SB397_01195 [Burkholderia multivorans]|nr:hypothetical protein [Burkholderia multivorans]MEB2566240.1 hypothetical protein [Burkholderia multivorans]